MAPTTFLDLVPGPVGVGPRSRPTTASSGPGPRGADTLDAFLEFIPPGREESREAVMVLETAFNRLRRLLKLPASPDFQFSRASQEAHQLSIKVVDVVHPVQIRIQRILGLAGPGPPPPHVVAILRELTRDVLELTRCLATMSLNSAVRLVLPWPSSIRNVEEQLTRIRALDLQLQGELETLQLIRSQER